MMIWFNTIHLDGWWFPNSRFDGHVLSLLLWLSTMMVIVNYSDNYCTFLDDWLSHRLIWMAPRWSAPAKKTEAESCARTVREAATPLWRGGPLGQHIGTGKCGRSTPQHGMIWDDGANMFNTDGRNRPRLGKFDPEPSFGRTIPLVLCFFSMHGSGMYLAAKITERLFEIHRFP